MGTLLTIKEVAKELEVSRKTVGRWVKSGKLPVVKFPSGRYRIDKNVLHAIQRGDLDKILQEGGRDSA